ncbi:MAG: AzlC family ABC transporter permease [Anaerolineae bacterium]
MTQLSAAHPPTRSREFWAGSRDTIPMLVGAAPFGLIFGALAVTSGLSPVAAQAMSLFVFAGSSQFIGANLVATGAVLPVIWLTTFVVNLRHALYSATLAPYVKRLPQIWLIPLGFWLTDETFVVVAKHYQEGPDSPAQHWYYFGSAIWMYVNWNFWTFLGIVAGQRIPDPARFGLDFALIVTFIGMLIPMIKNRPVLACVITAGVSAVLLNPLPNKLGLLIATVIGVVVGITVENQLPPEPAHPQETAS